MEEKFNQYLKTIKRVHRFGFKPRFEHQFKTQLNEKAFMALTLQLIQKLDWELKVADNNCVVALNSTSIGITANPSEKITISYERGTVSVKSESLNTLWDGGRNSIRVQLFVYCFETTARELKQDEISEFEKQEESRRTMADYVIPERLPSPPEAEKTRWALLFSSGLIVAGLISFLLAMASVRRGEIIIAYELLITLLLTGYFRAMIKLSRCRDDLKLTSLLLGMVILIFILNFYFQYLLVTKLNPDFTGGFMEFLKARWNGILLYDGVNISGFWIILYTLLRIAGTYLISLLALLRGLANYQVSRIPPEVIDFIIFHLNSKKNEAEIRKLLAQKGWTKKEDQDAAINAVGIIGVYLEGEKTG